MRKRTVSFLHNSLPIAMGLWLSATVSYANSASRPLLSRELNNTLLHTNTLRKVTGIVTDIKGDPLVGANILLKGTTHGVMADFDGKFTIEAPADGILEVSYIGFMTLEIPISQKNNLKIILKEDSKTLDGIVVVGYGTTSVRKNSASIATVDTEQVKEVPFSDMASALQGRVPGVIVQQGSAEPGQNGASISIRGNGEPLYVIDGFIATRQQFLSLNKMDIQSTTVLKDAASTAVYGMNAGNGVILVTTKKGAAGRLSVDYQANIAFNLLSYPTQRLNAYEYAHAVNKLRQALGEGINSFKNPEEMEYIADNLGQYTNWEDITMRKAAPQSEHTLSISGGNEKLRFFGSINYLMQDAIYSKDVLKYDRYNYRSNVSSYFEKIGLTVDFNVNGSVRDEKYPGAGAWTIYSRIRDRTPFENAYNEQGQLSNQFDNPMLILDGPGFTKMRTVYNQLALRLNLDIPKVKGWSVGFDGNYNIESQDRTTWNETATYYDDQGNPTVDKPENISISRSSYMNYRYDLSIRTDYKNTFAEKHNVQATLVHTRQFYHGNNLSAGSNTFYTNAIQQIQKGDASTITANNWQGVQASMGYVGRFRYDYADRYMIEFSGRYDGSDNFPQSKRFGFFPSVSAGWGISEEKFMEPFINKAGLLNYLKIRGSYGEIGINSADHWSYAYLPTYNYNSFAYVVDGKLVNSVTPGATPSVNMTWYTRTKYDVGLDFVIFSNKVSGSFDWFFEKTKGFLSAPNYEYTAPLGYSLPLEVSRAEDRSEGIDGHIKYEDKFGGVEFTAGFNFTYYNWLKAITNEDSVTLANPRIRQQGVKQGFVGTGYVGSQFYTSPDDILNNPKRITSKDLRPGDLWYQDVNGDGKIDGQDQMRYGHNASPSFVYGFDFSAAYKGFMLMATIQGTGSRQTYMNNYAQGSEGERRLDFKYQSDTWSIDNPNASFPRAGNASLNDNNNYASSDFWAKNSTYVRLKSLTLSYDVKSSLLSRCDWMQNLTLFASGVNLFAIGPSVKYGDPEANNFDGYNYPMTRTFSFGFQLGL